MEIVTVSILLAVTASAERFILADHLCVFVCPLRCTGCRKQIMALREDWKKEELPIAGDRINFFKFYARYWTISGNEYIGSNFTTIYLQQLLFYLI
jgi:hypothetical protein